ncbi:MAG: hypothetical protein E6Z28_05870 [Actinomyces urogenitalis]|uniref:hypothetical protein n=1 Tax=Actinomyces urogenitalis TaxID=103621 RepID=UPI001899D50D|nr:hypothetical protein [Actinomyces urogenitalis]MDU5874542.1 hypothetical protein [Actinomyces urogenitalis]
MPRLNLDPRTPAHFRVMRETLGISNADIARILDVSDRSVHKWNFTITAPDAAWEILDEQAERVQGSVDELLARAERQGEGEPVVLRVYPSDETAEAAGVPMPASWHRAAAGIAALALEGEGYRVEMVYPPRD